MEGVLGSGNARHLVVDFELKIDLPIFEFQVSTVGLDKKRRKRKWPPPPLLSSVHFYRESLSSGASYTTNFLCLEYVWQYKGQL